MTGEVEYKERYVAFLDLLGFKALVSGAERDTKERERLKEVLDLLRGTLCNNPRLGTRFSYFSDCAIITSDAVPEALWQIFHSVTTLTRNLLQFDVLARGGVTRGGAFHSEQYVYGTAVSRAAVLEKLQAKNPLTLLSSEVYADVKALDPAFLPLVESDGADRLFIHYLSDYTNYHRTPKLPGTVSLDADAKRIAFFISRRLLNDSDRVLAKAQWFQSYWNRCVARPGGFSEIHADVSLVEPDEPQTTIIQRIVGGTRQHGFTPNV